jgi:hypothetical protein
MTWFGVVVGMALQNDLYLDKCLLTRSFPLCIMQLFDPGAAPVGKVRLLAFSYWFLASKGKSNGVKNP